MSLTTQPFAESESIKLLERELQKEGESSKLIPALTCLAFFVYVATGQRHAFLVGIFGATLLGRFFIKYLNTTPTL